MAQVSTPGDAQGRASSTLTGMLNHVKYSHNHVWNNDQGVHMVQHLPFKCPEICETRSLGCSVISFTATRFLTCVRE